MYKDLHAICIKKNHHIIIICISRIYNSFVLVYVNII